MLAAIQIVNRVLKTPQRSIGLVERFTPFEIDVNSSAAIGASQTRIVLKPSEALLKLMAACRASQVDFGIVEKI